MSNRDIIRQREKSAEVCKQFGLVDFNTICVMSGLKKSTLYEYSLKPDFPAPKSIRRNTLLFSRQEIREWIRQRVSAARIAPAVGKRRSGVSPSPD